MDFEVSNGLSARQPGAEPERCRPPSQKNRFPDGQVLCGVHPVDRGHRRPETEKATSDVPYLHCATGSTAARR